PATPMPAPPTLPALFQATAQQRGQAPALKAKLSQGGWRSITWAGYAKYVQDLGNFLLSLGVQRGDRVALLGKNSPEWAVTDLATLHVGGATVAIYETLAPDKMGYILHDSGARIGFAGSKHQAETLLGRKGTALEIVVCFERVDGALGKQVLDYDEALAQGAAWAKGHPEAFGQRWSGVQPEDLAGLIYTSGTTGEPKGVMLTHRNFVSNATAASEVVDIGPDDVFLSFLPLSHSFERLAGHYFPIARGATVAYAESIEKLPENLQEIKPTVMTAVPRLFEKMWARVEAASREQGKEKIVQRAVGVGRQHARLVKADNGKAPFVLGLQQKLFDRLVYQKVRDRVGGRIRYFVTGGAHIPEELEWNFTAVGLPIYGGYGLTETSPVIAVNRPGAWRPGSVGQPIPGVEVRIEEDGEILARGPNVMKGYYKKPEETAKVLTGDGWLRTGDIGHLDKDGYLYVTDRKKELFKTSGGKYIAPQSIENLLRESPYIAEAVAVGDDRNHVTALLVPDFERLAAWAKEHNVPQERDALLADHRLEALLHSEVDKVNAKLSKFETVKQFRVLKREFTQEGGELTPTLKVKRRVVAEKYRDLIEGMYHHE
ncbi:MAG TPA: long-chain fatty acid--CoA ligase, partial [Ramlibacter sp.]|nr:long-chain fatty acid--CoA ligase [Ramlibacter sp.]